MHVKIPNENTVTISTIILTHNLRKTKYQMNTEKEIKRNKSNIKRF